MAKLHTYRVETPSGTITRRTARTYTHVVVTRVDQRTLIEGRIADRVARVRGWLQAAQDRVSGGVPSIRAQTDVSEREHLTRIATLFDKRVLTAEELEAGLRANAERMLADAVVRVRDYEWRLSDENLAAERKALVRHAAAHGVIGWCGRLDLAQKLAAKNPAAMILEVPQP